ncbi:MAG: NifB/NifX family molybdenum-iron cluster-binding protein [Candidatus Electryonea clarkiae]|nr:NifB/NifX family molybdenum-iron cluster-binding protein [Candidatus Electryonea clarkiae]MDP8285253.1 NifB/NifX family molybdenum-iron cluster-binding protein [Candidatus Electryonea clarkiae]
MKVAISTAGDSLESNLDPRFGRCSYFLFVDQDSDEVKVVNNLENVELSGGAGIQSAELVVRNGADVIITGHCGPKAFSTLQAADIKIFPCQGMTAQQALEKFKQNELKPLNGPDVQSHWS